MTLERLTCAAIAIPGDAPPAEFRIWQWGDNPTERGVITLDEKSAHAVVEAYAKKGVELAIDYEHQTFHSEKNGARAPAAGWFRPEVRADGLWAADVRWTDTATAHLKAREYRYYSPVVAVDKATRRPARLLPMALTNHPATSNLQPLMMRDGDVDDEEQETSMTTKNVALLMLFGLSADADEAIAVEEARKAVDFRKEVLSLSGASTMAESLGTLRAHAQAGEKVVKLTAQLKELEGEKRRGAFDGLVKRGQESAQLSPAMVGGEWLMKLRDSEDGAEQLTAFLKSAPKLVEGSADKREAEATGSGKVDPATARMARVGFGRSSSDLVELEKYKAQWADEDAAARGA